MTTTKFWMELVISNNLLKCNICNNKNYYGDFIIKTDGITSEQICKNCIVDESNKVLNDHRKNSNDN